MISPQSAGGGGGDGGSNNNPSPPPNPFLAAHEKFVQTTPYLTRTLLTIQVLSYLLSWIWNPHYALSNIPQFVIFQLEIYRLVLSPLFVNTQLFTLLFAFLSFAELGKRLEYSMGTVAFGWFCMGVALLANIGFVVCSLLVYLLTGDQGYLLSSSSGIWLIIFGAIAAECSQAPAEMKRRFFFCEVPVRYYPVALYALFALLGSASMAHAISLGAGYLYGGQGNHLDFLLKLSQGKAHEWETNPSWPLANLAREPGWVAGHAALGSDAWSQVPMHETPGSGFLSSLIRPNQPTAGSGAAGAAGSSSSPMAGSVIMPGRGGTAGNNHDFAGSAGHTLGSSSSSTNRRVTDARAARLQALERRSENNV